LQNWNANVKERKSICFGKLFPGPDEIQGSLKKIPAQDTKEFGIVFKMHTAGFNCHGKCQGEAHEEIQKAYCQYTK
jgi:hypothetical protein